MTKGVEKRPSNPGEGLSLPLSLFLKSNRKRLFGEKGKTKSVDCGKILIISFSQS